MPGYDLAIAATTLVGQSLGPNRPKDAYSYGMLTGCGRYEKSLVQHRHRHVVGESRRRLHHEYLFWHGDCGRLAVDRDRSSDSSRISIVSF